ncbi:MAG: hypothetical protein QM757_31035 [Paludibaculum sp.]
MNKLGRGWIWKDDAMHSTNHVFRIRLNAALALPKFVSYFTNHMSKKYFFDEGKQTTNLASINMTKLRAMPLPLPPLTTRRRSSLSLKSTSLVDNLATQIDGRPRPIQQAPAGDSEVCR